MNFEQLNKRFDEKFLILDKDVIFYIKSNLIKYKSERFSSLNDASSRLEIFVF